MRKSAVCFASLFLLGLLLTSAQSLYAQKGVYLGVKLAGTSISFEEDLDEVWDDGDKLRGGGLELDLGYNFSSQFGLFATFGGYSLEDSDWNVGYFDIGPRFFLVPEGNIKPYLDLTLTGSAIQYDDEDLSYRGGGLSGGGGVQFYIAPRAAINLGVLVSRVNYDEVEVGNLSVDDLENKAWNSRFKLGMSFYF